MSGTLNFIFMLAIQPGSWFRVGGAGICLGLSDIRGFGVFTYILYIKIIYKIIIRYVCLVFFSLIYRTDIRLLLVLYRIDIGCSIIDVCIPYVLLSKCKMRKTRDNEFPKQIRRLRTSRRRLIKI